MSQLYEPQGVLSCQENLDSGVGNSITRRRVLSQDSETLEISAPVNPARLAFKWPVHIVAVSVPPPGMELFLFYAEQVVIATDEQAIRDRHR